jgi:hypothetical protein
VLKTSQHSLERSSFPLNGIDMDDVEHSLGSPLILLTGATGYIGGRSLKALKAAGKRGRRYVLVVK